jgi:hypothetical protein
MVIGEPIKLNEADMTEMLTQSQDLWGGLDGWTFGKGAI